jgi:citronellol/citronellal dehydrogenase
MTAGKTSPHYDSVFRPGLFAGRTIIVTGAGSGIGRATAHELAELGAHVVLLGRDQGKLDRVVGEITEDSGSADWHSVDIRDEPRVVEVLENVLADHGRIDALVNNAGGQYRHPLAEISTKGFDAVVRNNLTGGFVMMREVYNRCMAAHGGAIVNMVADMWGGWPMYGHSGAARSGMWTLTQTAAAEWGASGVRVNAVAPGSIASSGLDTYESSDDDYLRRDVSQEIPLQRWGTESEVAAAIVFLLSPAAAFITGSCIRLDGGAPNGARAWVTAPPARNVEQFDGFHRAAGAALLRTPPG